MDVADAVSRSLGEDHDPRGFEASGRLSSKRSHRERFVKNIGFTLTGGSMTHDVGSFLAKEWNLEFANCTPKGRTSGNGVTS
jgi:hypothetical protein